MTETKNIIYSGIKNETSELSFDEGAQKNNKKMLETMAEAKAISKDPCVKGYRTMQELITALDEE